VTSGPGDEAPAAAGGDATAADGATLVQRLRTVEIFSDLGDDDLAWLARHSRVAELAAGEVLIRRGDPAWTMFVVLAGELHSRREDGVSDGRLFVRRTGQTGGVLPWTRLTESPVTIRAVVPSTVACFARSDFPAMFKHIPVLEQRLAGLMVDRVRQTAQMDQQRERLAGLGKLAAGLAHELNNPVAAIQRSSDELRRSIEDLVTVGREVLGGVVGAEALARFEAMGRDGDVDSSGRRAAPVDRLARSDAEDAVASALDRVGVADPWSLAEGLVASGVLAEDLERALVGLDPGTAWRVLRWLDAARGSVSLLEELSAAAGRVVGLVASVKGFSQMDQERSTADLDVREGIVDTLAVMAHAIRDRDITVHQEHAPELPPVRGVAGDLNQVWLNLLDNAIDAAGDGGRVALRTRAGESEVLVDVEDDGPGIPPDVVGRIFEPFFTTKPVGEGTGLGLELVRRVVIEHGGDVNIETAPGRTVFRVRLPAAGT
jgi:signal transduction histidine kinase